MNPPTARELLASFLVLTGVFGLGATVADACRAEAPGCRETVGSVGVFRRDACEPGQRVEVVPQLGHDPTFVCRCPARLDGGAP